MMSRIPSLSEIFSWILTLITSLRIPAPSEIFSWYASLTTTAMMARTAVRDFLPAPAQQYLHALAQSLFGRRLPPGLTLIFDATTGYTRNEIFDAAEAYLATKINHDTDCLHVTKTAADKNLFFSLENNERIVDKFRGLELTWRFFRSPGSSSLGGRSDPSNPAGSIASPEKRCFQLSFPKEHKELVLGSYIPFVLDELKAMRHEERVLKIHTLDNKNYHHIGPWNSVNLDHPATFDTLAMEPSLKEAIVQDLDRFRSRKDFYKRVGRAWKRGYLLYGPPGTGKSSLIGAMANYLKFDVYDLQLASVQDDCDLRRVLLATGNRSILVIEDIDCGADLPDRNEKKKKKPVQASTVHPYDPYARQPKITLSGLLNFIDGLWSSCGDERIIVFTTNHKEKLDPALLRPGRMDMHVHMSYCTHEAFKVLANNYLGADGGAHRLCEEIGGLIGDVRVTPAQVAEELMKSNDADVALGEVVSLLKRKRVEAAMAKPEIEKEEEEEEEEEKVGDGEEDGSAVVEMDKQLINGDVKGHKEDPVGWNKLVKSMSARNVTLRRRRR